MQMSEFEIRQMYRDAKDKKKQITILAELNGTTKDEIICIVSAQGAATPIGHTSHRQ